MQPPKVQTQESAPTPPPRDQPSKSPSLDYIPLIKILQNIRRYPRFSKPENTQAAPQKVQHHLCRSPHQFGKNFRTQAAQHLVANNLFKLPHAFHIYNKQGGKENIDTLLMGGDSDTWWKTVINEFLRLSNWVDNWLRATNTI